MGSSRARRHRIEYLLLRVFVATAAMLPRGVMLWLGARLGDVLYLAGFHRRIVRRNMEFVGLWPPEEQYRITRALYRTLGRYAVDFVRPATRPLPFTVEGEQVLIEQTAGGCGAVAIGAHFGNWELLATFFAERIPDLNLVVKPMNNPLVEEWLTRRRLQSGASAIPPRSALRRSLRILERNGVVAIMIDQYAGAMGTPAPFLGKHTRTIRTVAGLANRTGCGVFAIYALLKDDGTYRVVVETPPPLDHVPPDRNAAVTALQENHNQMISEWIREYPEHWFGWFHRRFKDVLDYQNPSRSETVCHVLETPAPVTDGGPAESPDSTSRRTPSSACARTGVSPLSAALPHSVSVSRPVRWMVEVCAECTFLLYVGFCIARNIARMNLDDVAR